MTMTRTFGELIRDRRTELGLSQIALSEMLDVSQPTIARWETDQVLPKPPQLSPLAGALEIPLEQLLEPLGERVPKQPLREEIEGVVERLDNLEQNVEAILKILRRRSR